jgi:hypothetical protein
VPALVIGDDAERVEQMRRDGIPRSEIRLRSMDKHQWPAAAAVVTRSETNVAGDNGLLDQNGIGFQPEVYLKHEQFSK